MNEPKLALFLRKLALTALLSAWVASPLWPVLEAAPSISVDEFGPRAEREDGEGHKPEEGLAGLRRLLGEDVCTHTQTAAALGIISLLADDGRLDDLVAFLDRMNRMAGVRDAIAWYANELIVQGDDLVNNEDYGTALVLYQAVPSRDVMLETQALALERQRENLRLLEAAAESKSPDTPPATTSDLIDSLKSDIKTNEKALAAIQKNENVDAALTMRRGRCFYHLSRFEEALLCFRTLRLKFPTFKDSQLAAYAEITLMQELNRSTGLLGLCKDYLKAYPDSAFAEAIPTIAGEVRYSLSLRDANDKAVAPDKIIADLNAFSNDFPTAAPDGPMLCLLADVYQRKGGHDDALAAYKKALWTESPDDVIKYALDSATTILQSTNDWNAIAELHREFLLKCPNSQLAPLAAAQVVKMKLREDKGEEAARILAEALGTNIGDPANEQVESLLDLMAQSLVPRKRPAKKEAEPLAEQLDRQLAAILTDSTGDNPSPTATARQFYAQARLSQLLERTSRTDRSDLLLKTVAINFASTPAVLSPTLLSACGDILLQEGNLDAAEAMYLHLKDSYKNSSFSDAGPLGLGNVALARKQPKEAIRIFDDSLVNNTGTSRFRETTLGKLQALIDLGQYEDARTLAQQIIDDKAFHGEMAGKAYLMFAGIYRVEAARAPDGTDTDELRRKAYATYQRIYIAYQNLPGICAEAYWQASETAKELHQDALAAENLKALAIHPKLQATQRAKDAKKSLP